MLFKKFKNYILAGLIAILPLWITFFILRLAFNVITGIAKPYLQNVPILADNVLILNLTSFICTVLFVFLLGILLTNVVGRRLFLLFENAVQRIPLLSWIYTSIRKLTALFYREDDDGQFKRVVMIEYPRKGIHVIGFLTTDVIEIFNQKSGQDLVNIFLPTTPNPTSGFLLMVPRKDVTPLDISTEDAVKLIVSAGITTPGDVS